MEIYRPTLLRQLFLSVLLLALSAVTALAQPGRGQKIQASGQVVDNKTNEPMVGAAVKVTSADGGTGTFGICDSQGNFTFEVNHPGKYTLEITYVSYKTLTKEVNIWPGRAKLGVFKIKEDPHMLSEVETIGHSERIKQRGDTLAYNADAYKVQDGATAEELVGKLPGIEVSSDGVKAQGEEVKKILVDGKEFFDNDVKMALRSLPAEVLESVNVFDKKSDQAEFTGIDDGETVKAMDLVTKAYRRNGVFGKVFGGVGSNFNFDAGYWNTGFNINRFNGDRRITFQGMSNNVNERNFSNDDMSGGMMMGRQWGARGVARTHGLGVNFQDSYLQNKVDVELSYFFNQSRTLTTDTSYVDEFERTIKMGDIEKFMPASSSFSGSSSVGHSMSHRFGGRITIRPTKQDEIMIRPSLNIQGSDSEGFSTNRRWNHALDLVNIDGKPQSLWDDFQRFDQSITSSESDSWNLGGMILWRHRLQKPGRTFSAMINGNLSGSDSENRTAQTIKYHNVDGLVTTPINQVNLRDNSNSSLRGNVQWTEPLATGLNLSLRYDYSFTQSKRENDINFYDDVAFSTGYRRDSLNTNIYEQKNWRNSGEVGLSYRHKTLTLNASVRLENSKLEGEQDYFLLLKGIGGNDANRSFSTSKSYFSILPNFRFEYRTAGGTQFRVNYRASSRNPSIDNLQQSVNTSNASNYSTGNPYLDQSTSHNVNFNMIYTNTETAQNFMIFGGINTTQNQISNQTLTNKSNTETMRFADLPGMEGYLDSYGFSDDIFKGLELKPGARITRPVNRNGNMSAHLNFGYGFPFDAIMSNVNISMGGSYSLNPSNQLYFDLDKQGKENIINVESKTRNYSFNPRVHVSSNISTDLNFNLMYMPMFMWVDDQSGNSQDKSYINHNLNASLNWTFWEGFTTDQSLGWSRNGGPSQPEAIEQWIWNASIGKKFLKGNKAEIKLQAYDILGSNKGFTRSVGDANISMNYRNFMPRYFLLTFTYKITAYKAGGKQSTRAEEGGFGGPGGPGGRGGWGGPGRGGFGGF